MPTIWLVSVLVVVHPMKIAADPGDGLTENVGWARRDGLGPSPRYGSPMAYDEQRGVTVLFGGYDGQERDDTWEWNGNSWTQLAPAAAPSKRHEHGMAYDRTRGKVVLFGGFDGTQFLGDTWTWDGSDWTLESTSGPSPRNLPAMAFDSWRNETVLFGGNYQNTGLGDTWVWDGQSWSERGVSGPSGRYEHAMTFDSVRGIVVLFGGGLPAYADDETWSWDGTMWTKLPVPQPLPDARFLHAMAFDAFRGVTVLFGGWRRGYQGQLNDTWEFDGVSWAERVVPAPSARSDLYAAYDAKRHKTMLFGGWDGTYDGETWEYPMRPMRTTEEIWSMAGHEGRTVARVDLGRNRIHVYGVGLHDPVRGDDGGEEWTTLAISPQRTLYLMRRYFNDVHLYSLDADNIVVNGQGIITNLVDEGLLGIGGNIDGLTYGPDGNLYLSTYDASGGPVRNGLYRYNLGLHQIEYVGTFRNNSAPGAPNSFHTDLAFDPITGDLIGIGFGPNGNMTLFRLDRYAVLSGTNQVFDWQYFAPAWQNVQLRPYGSCAFGDGIAFDPTTGDLYLSDDTIYQCQAGGVARFDRELAVQLGWVGDSNGYPPGLGYDLDFNVRPQPRYPHMFGFK